ncbi:MAG: LLM class F420-dependent oxidoreductase [Dehalococcoidia bacterium]
MQFGVSIFPADYAIGPVELARVAEDTGFESLWFPEHIHIPVSRRTPFPGGEPLPTQYYHSLDPFVALGAAAAVTSRLKLGTSICLVIERDPITLAKEVATLDHLSGGRFLFGIGGGWNHEEMANHGTKPALRWQILRERVLAMKQIWTADEAEYHGRFVDFDPIWSWPKPVQRPHPPILMGGAGPRTLERVVEYCDEWMPIAGRGGAPLHERIAELNNMAAVAGRAPVPVSIFGTRPERIAIERYLELGVHRMIYWLPPAGADEVLPFLARCAEVSRPYM